MKTYKVCEYVSSGHPDKLADQISDHLLDMLLQYDEDARAAIECMVKDNVVVLGGEVTSCASIDYNRGVKDVFDDVHYPSNHHLMPSDIKIINLIGEQSNEIANGIDKDSGDNIGAGDQGFMVGYACNETEEGMPLGYVLAREICNNVSNLDRDFDAPFPRIGPDIKTQVTMVYEDGLKPYVDSVVVSAMHNGISLEDTREIIEKCVINTLGDLNTEDVTIYVNPCGEWKIGGPISDCGLTGRKIVVDNYGSYCTVGGGAFSGKDMTKVDRSGAYMCRFLAKNILATNLCDAAKVELGYVISRQRPCALNIELTNPRNEKTVTEITQWIKAWIDLTPKGIIERFPYVDCQMWECAKNGHFGVRNGEQYRPWERIDRYIVDTLKLFCS